MSDDAQSETNLPEMRDRPSTETSKQSKLEFDDLTHWRERAEIPTQFVFRDTLARAIVACVASMGGVGKSWLVVTLAISAITGKTLLQSFVPAGRFKVILLAGEDEFTFVAKRLKKITMLFGDQIADKELDEAMERNLRIRCARPQALAKVVNGQVLPTEFYKALRREAATADFIIIDPLAKFHGLPTENENAQVSQFMNLLQGLCVPNGALVLFTHHINKTAQRDRDIEIQSGPRGASAWVDEARFCAVLRAAK